MKSPLLSCSIFGLPLMVPATPSSETAYWYSSFLQHGQSTDVIGPITPPRSYLSRFFTLLRVFGCTARGFGGVPSIRRSTSSAFGFGRFSFDIWCLQ